MSACIQCGTDVDLVIHEFTLYQVDGRRYIYCEKCKSPREPYTSPAEVKNIKKQLELYRRSILRLEWVCISIAIVGFAVGWYFG